MENTATTQQPEKPVEITKEAIGAAAEAYAEGQLGEALEPHRTHYKAKIKTHWFAGWLAHSYMLEPYVNQITQTANSLAAISDAAREFVELTEALMPELDMPEYIALKTLLNPVK